MATYLLLRNNRESGPLTKEQIITLGLKPYDLIWVEGRSAAWRYANEIPDLKDYAPAVEEQPYDRFYKRTSTDPVKEYVEETVKKHAEQPVKKMVEEIVSEREVEIVQKNAEEPLKNYSEQPIKKQIDVPVMKPEEEIVQEYVKELKRENGSEVSRKSMIEGGQEDLEELLKKYGNQQNNGSVSVIMPKQSNPVKKEEPVIRKITVVDRIEPPVEKKIPAPASHLEDSVNMQTNYSTPLDEIKERYVRQLSDRKNANAQRKFIKQTLKRAAIFIVVIGAGVLIGFAIKPRRINKSQVAETSLQSVPAVNNSGPAKDETVLNSNNTPVETLPSAANENVDVVAAEHKYDKLESSKQVEEKKSLENTAINPSVVESANGERGKNVRTNNNEIEPVEKRNVAGADLSDQVSVKANDYKERDFGGFRNLQLTVKNDSKVTLETVTVEVTYKKYNDDIASIKNVTFRAINPGDTLTIKVPDNNRGAKLSYRIVRIDPRNP